MCRVNKGCLILKKGGKMVSNEEKWFRMKNDQKLKITAVKTYVLYTVRLNSEKLFFSCRYFS